MRRALYGRLEVAALLLCLGDRCRPLGTPGRALPHPWPGTRPGGPDPQRGLRNRREGLVLRLRHLPDPGRAEASGSPERPDRLRRDHPSLGEGAPGARGLASRGTTEGERLECPNAPARIAGRKAIRPKDARSRFCALSITASHV